MNVVFVLLSMLDVLAGLTLYLQLERFVIFFAYYSVLKGLYSIIASALSGFYLDWMGAVDLLTGVFLFLQVFSWFGIVMIAKGVYSLILSLL